MLQMQDSSQLVCCDDLPQERTLDPHSSQSLGEYLKNAITNLTYNLKHSNYLSIPGLLRERVVLRQNDTSVYLFGKEYTFYSEEEFIKHFQSTIWFSYRKNIPGVGDDRGWGCMIRSAMMMVAEALKRTTNLPSSHILNHFKEKEKGAYCFTSLCKAGEIDKRWTTSSEIMHICDKVSRSDRSVELNIVNIPISCFILSNIEQEMMKRPYQSTLLVLHTKLAFLPHLKSLMKLPYFCGLLGGVPREAMYILGYKDEKVICLDPHYVQDDNQTDQSYFKRHPRGLDYQKLSSCVSIGFFISGLSDLHSLVKELFVIEKQVKENRVIGLMLEQGKRMKLEEEYEIESNKSRKMSADDFEVLE